MAAASQSTNYSNFPFPNLSHTCNSNSCLTASLVSHNVSEYLIINFVFILLKCVLPMKKKMKSPLISCPSQTPESHDPSLSLTPTLTQSIIST